MRGKALDTDGRGKSCWDHPRVCGEKCSTSRFEGCLLGSPPRMRGKENRQHFRTCRRGITPAYAGKSPTGVKGLSVNRDHPRVCGEKLSMNTRILSIAGSPPRMRGKGGCFAGLAHRFGITPAYAGKRKEQYGKKIFQKDHPRVCGEKFTLSFRVDTRPGSPPRMRGKVSFIVATTTLLGITPAYAGKRARKENYGESR